MVNGNETTVAVLKSGELDAIPDTIRLQAPLLLIVSGRSRKEPGQTSPKSPVLAINVAIAGAPAVPLAATVTEGFTGSSLDTVNVAD